MAPSVPADLEIRRNESRMALHHNPDKYKMFAADTGLFVTLAFWDKEFTDNTIYHTLFSDKLSADLGHVYENAIDQMLKAAGHELYYYTFPTESGKHNYEEWISR